MSIDQSSPAKSRLLVEQAIDEAMDDLAQRNQARAERESERVTSTRVWWVRVSLAIALPVLVTVTVWNVIGAPAIAAPLLGSTASRSEVEASLKTVVEDIEAFEADYGELPTSLTEIGAPNRGDWRYVRIGNDRYHLVVSLGGQVVRFDRR